MHSFIRKFIHDAHVQTNGPVNLLITRERAGEFGYQFDFNLGLKPTGLKKLVSADITTCGHKLAQVKNGKTGS